MPLATERTLATHERIVYRHPRESREMFAARIDHMLPELRYIMRCQYPNRRVRATVHFAADDKSASVQVSTLKNREEL